MSTNAPTDQGVPDYFQRVDVHATPATIFDAITTIEGLRGWWTPIVSGSTDVGSDVRFDFEGLDEHVVMRIDEATPASKVQWTCIAHTGHPEWIGTQPTFEIALVGGHGTALYFRHVGLAPPLSCYQQCERGWDHFLASIVAYVESGRGTPFGS